MGNSAFGIAVIGCGTVGGAVSQLLLNDNERLSARSGCALELRGVVSRTFARGDEFGIPANMREHDLRALIEDERVRLVVETVGGIEPAKGIVEQALAAGKHVVTANKALLAEHGPELYTLARERGVSIAFEASCAGGIPIVRTLYDALVANEIEALYGIVNGTSNYILSRMVDAGISFPDALAEAQREGYAEADPTLDVDGTDSAHKLAILSSLAFGIPVHTTDVQTEGINALNSEDVAYASHLGYVVKLLAIARRQSEGVSLLVRPAFISRSHPLAWVSGPFNAISVYGNVTGHTMYYGRGAGGAPTAGAVVSDIVSIARGTYPRVFAQAARLGDTHGSNGRTVPVRSPATLANRYYMRLEVRDTPGTLSKIAAVFAEHSISIASVLQSEAPEDGTDHIVPVVITLHRTREGDLAEPLERIGRLAEVAGEVRPIAIVDEHPEAEFTLGG
ncbi:MAG: homoserine dehydrogenase [Spirochaetales bacterium]